MQSILTHFCGLLKHNEVIWPVVDICLRILSKDVFCQQQASDSKHDTAWWKCSSFQLSLITSFSKILKLELNEVLGFFFLKQIDYSLIIVFDAILVKICLKPCLPFRAQWFPVCTTWLGIKLLPILFTQCTCVCMINISNT